MTITRLRRSVAAATVLLGLGASPAFAQVDATAPKTPETAEPVTKEMVAVELVLLVDTSGSVDEVEYQLQQQGYVDAFRNANLIEVIQRYGGIAVTYVEWSSTDHQEVRIPWTKIENGTQSRAFAAQVNEITRTHTGWTRVAPALDFAANLVATNDFISWKRVIDVSGDGRCQNFDFYADDNLYDPAYGIVWDDAIRGLQGRIDQVNGICITTSESVVDFYENHLIQGNEAFAMQVDSFGAFGDAILQKLIREIGTIPGTYD